MDELQSILREVGVTAIYIILAGVLSTLGVFAIKIAKKLFAKIGIQLTEEQLLSIQGVITKIVKQLNQTIVIKLKSTNVDNKLTDEQANKIYNDAVNLITNTLTPKEKEFLISKYGDFSVALKILVESTVADNHVSLSEVKDAIAAETHPDNK